MGPGWAHIRPSVAEFGASAGPIQDDQWHILKPMLDPYKAISTKCWDQCWAHTRQSALYFEDSSGPIQDDRLYILKQMLGPYKAISTIFWGQCWAHTRQSVTYFGTSAGPMRQLVEASSGPIQDDRQYIL